MDFLSLCVTALCSFGALLIMAKVIGHKQIAQPDFIDYITGITIGSAASAFLGCDGKQRISQLRKDCSQQIDLIHCNGCRQLARIHNMITSTPAYATGSPL